MTIEKPEYTDTDKWDVVVGHNSIGEALEVTVKPTQKCGLLLKAWAAENDLDQGDFRMEIPEGTSWTSGAVNSESLIGDSGLLDGGYMQVKTKA